MKNVYKQLIAPLTLVCAPLLYAQETALDEIAADGTPEYIIPGDESSSTIEIPEMFRDDALLDESHSNRELGINVYTAPSISKIFDQLEKLPAIPEEYVQPPARLRWRWASCWRMASSPYAAGT